MVKLKVGDEVKYSRRFLYSTGMLTGETPFAKGKIVSFEHLGVFPRDSLLVEVDWGSPEIPRKVLSFNLVLVGEIELA